jgi:ribonucleoside-diphosphate reductase alpha chain
MGSLVKIDDNIIGWRVNGENDGSLPKSIGDSHAPRRPLELDCEIHHATIKGEAWTILVSKLDGRPYEILGGLSMHIEIPKKYTYGTVIKNPRKTVNSRYDLLFGENGDEVLVKDIVSVFDNPNHGALTRMISMSLRHGVPIQYIAEQLQKDRNSDMFSFSKVVSRVLKRYIEDGTSGAGSCSECGSGQLIYQAGCPVCKDCGYSKCG